MWCKHKHKCNHKTKSAWTSVTNTGSKNFVLSLLVLASLSYKWTRTTQAQGKVFPVSTNTPKNIKSCSDCETTIISRLHLIAYKRNVKSPHLPLLPVVGRATWNTPFVLVRDTIIPLISIIRICSVALFSVWRSLKQKGHKILHCSAGHTVEQNISVRGGRSTPQTNPTTSYVYHKICF